MIPECDIFPAKITGAVGSKGYPFAEQTVVGGTLTNFVDGRKVTSGDSDLACTVLGGGTVASGDYGTMLMFQDIGTMRYVFVPMGKGEAQRGILNYQGEWVYDTPTPLRIQDGDLRPGPGYPEHASGLTFRPESPTSSGNTGPVEPPAPQYLRHYIMDEGRDLTNYGNFIKRIDAGSGDNDPWEQWQVKGYIQDRYKHLYVNETGYSNEMPDTFYAIDKSTLVEEFTLQFGLIRLFFKWGVLVNVEGTPGETSGYTGTIPPGSTMYMQDGIFTGFSPP